MNFALRWTRVFLRKRWQLGITAVVVLLAALPLATLVSAHASSGAIFTTVVDGSEVNLNHFPSKESVYLDGGPGPGAPQSAAGLTDGRYVFQVTDPSGKVLLSTDRALCRRFDVANGIIASVVPAGGCQHATGLDVDHGAATVQLFPYNNTPNNGGVYKAWVTFENDFLAGCAALGTADGLNVVDCGGKTGGNAHGFVPAHSKTDNFKVKNLRLIREIDVIFFRDINGDGHYDAATEPRLANLPVTWTDTLGVQNVKFSYFQPAFGHIEAHVEAVESGVHSITIGDLSGQGCVVGRIHLEDLDMPAPGPQTVIVDMSDLSNSDKDVSIHIWVACAP